MKERDKRKDKKLSVWVRDLAGKICMEGARRTAKDLGAR
jgi:hypothetical protein